MAPKSDLFLFTVTLLLLLPLPVFPFLSDATANSSAFKFLEHLKGCRKGDNVKGINDLKKYLHRFGYLNYMDQIHSDDDDFDELLEEAVKAYQLNYHLDPTGRLDDKTISEMMMTRCGMPDIINGTRSMRSAEIKGQHRTHSIHNTVHYTLPPQGYKWPPAKYKLTYGFLPNTPPAAVTAVPRALATWAKSTHFKFSKAQSYEKADIKVGFYRRSHYDGAFDGPGGVLAHANYPPGGLLHFDADDKWVDGAKPGAIDIETVALHELGHTLGLDHSTVEGAIMYPSVPEGDTKRGLHQDDIQGIKALYKT